eukprot:SAG31_NODE_36890_length_309_cov_0.957143_1_plen_59_part_01
MRKTARAIANLTAATTAVHVLHHKTASSFGEREVVDGRTIQVNRNTVMGCSSNCGGMTQ